MRVGARVLERIADPRLGAEMDDPVEVVPLQRVLQCVVIAEVTLDEVERFTRSCRDACKPVALQRDRVIGVQVVDPDHAMATRHQCLGQRGTDEACRSGNQNVHAGLLARACP